MEKHKIQMKSYALTAMFCTVIPVLVTVSLCFFLTGCGRFYLRKNLKQMIGSTVMLPTDMSMVINGEITTVPNNLIFRPKLVVYIDTSGCSMCRISNIADYEYFKDTSNIANAFEIVLLVAEGEIERIPISRIVADQDYKIPVYIDKEGTFLKDNPQIPYDWRYHSFFVDSFGKIVFVGDPTHNEDLLLMINTYLKEQILL